VPQVPSARTGSYEKIHKVGIVSLLGTSIGIRDRRGKDSSVDASSWHVDDAIGALVRKYLGSRFEFVDVEQTAGPLRNMPQVVGRESRTLAYLKSVPNPGVDAYLVIRPEENPMSSPDGIALTAVEGGMLLWTNFEITVVDTRSFKSIGRAFARVQTRENQEPLFAITGIAGLTVGAPLALGATDASRVQIHLNELLPVAVLETIRALKFDVPLPPIGDHSISQPALAAKMAHIRSVAVVSVVGDRLRLISGGHALTGKGTAGLPIAAWGIDEQVEATAREVLSRHYAIKQVSVDRKALSDFTVIPTVSIGEIPGLQTSTEVDAYVLIVKASRAQTPFPDLGILHWTPMLSEETTTVYANYAILVVDARTLDLIAVRIAVPPPRKLCGEPRMPAFDVPSCLIDNKLAPTPDGQISEAAQEEVRTRMSDLLAKSVPETLFRLGLDSPRTTATAN
jgi:hypothetical protein